jgi:chromosome partitioning protein
MLTIALASRKGGAGKSTLAAHLSVLANKPDSPALLVDTDPQGSLGFWFSRRKDDTPLAVSCPAIELTSVLAAARKEPIGWCFVDTPPNNTAAIAEVIRNADLTIIPMRPAAFDLAASASTIELCKKNGGRFVVVLNAVPPRRGPLESGVVPEARKAIDALDAPIWEGAITARAAFSYALTEGLAVSEFDPGSLASYEVSKLWSYLQDETGTHNPSQSATLHQAPKGVGAWYRSAEGSKHRWGR